MSRPLIVGTAGHIDHGKTSLVRALTGADLDRLPEEQARGITIALGHAPLDLGEGRFVALVDVPGHERLVRTMIAGASGIDAVLLCVSAVDGVMPQTLEHLAVLELVGIERGAVVLTMADLVEDDLLELAEAEVADAVAGTFLEGAPIVASSALTGRGREELLALLRSFEPPPRREEGPFRLPVDRAFVRSGFGTVVTGTAWSGSLEDGQTVWLHPWGRKARVRGLEVHGREVERARAGHRVAINLAAIDRDQVPRGTVVSTEELPCSHVVDVTFRLLPTAPPLADGSLVRILLGTAEVLGRIHFAHELDELTPGGRAAAQLRLDSPLVCLPGDRFVVRRTSPLDTLGGGVVIDPWAHRMRKRDRERSAAQIARLASGEVSVWLERAGASGLGVEEWAHRRALVGFDGESVGERLGDRLYAPAVVARLEGALLEALAGFHTEQPLSLGAQRRELRRGTLGHLPDRVFDALVDRLAAMGQIRVDGPLLRAIGFEVRLSPEQQAFRDAVLRSLRDHGMAGMTPRELQEAHSRPELPAVLRLLESEGEVVPIPGLGWMAAEVLEELQRRVRSWFAEHDTMSAGDFKEISGTTRKSAIPLLEWLDKARLTRRIGDERTAGPSIVQ